MKSILRNLIVALSLCFLPTAALATCGTGIGTCFVVPAGGAWVSGTFSALSGGVTCACVPATGDALILDSAAGNLSSVVGNPSLASLDASGTGGSGSPYTGTFTHTASQTITITGNLFKLVAGMTYTIGSATTSIVKFASTSGTTAITTGGKTLPQITFDGVGGTFQFQDAFSNNTGGSVTLTNGALDTNSQTVSTGGLTSTNANTRSITLGTTAWTLTPASGISAWDLTTGTNLTLSAASSTINVVQTNASASTGVNFIYGGSGCTGCNSYGTIGIGANIATGTQGFFFTGTVAWTIATLNITAPNAIRFPNSVTTITNALTWTGTASNPIYVSWSGAGGTASNNITANASSTPSWIILRGIHFNGSGNIVVANCLNVAGNTFSGTGACNAPAGGGSSVGIIGGGI